MKHHFEIPLSPRGIDVKRGLVRGATICTAGVEAQGHGLKTDIVLLRQLLESAKRKGTVPVALDHKSGVRGTAGAAKNFRIAGNKLIADIQFFKTHADFPLVMDQLSTLGGTMGISASFVGDAEDGKARCRDLLGCDVVKWPAACPTGLFSARDEDEPEDDDMNEPDEPQSIEELLHSILDHLEDVGERVAHLEAVNELLVEALDELQGGGDGEQDDDDPDEDEPVLSERGARGGPNDYASALRSHDFENRIESLQLSGMDEKAAHIAALKEFARAHFDTANL